MSHSLEALVLEAEEQRWKPQESVFLSSGRLHLLQTNKAHTFVLMVSLQERGKS